MANTSARFDPDTERIVMLHVVALMPVRDDWVSATELIRRLDRAISSHPCTLDVLLVDDGSIEQWDPAGLRSDFVAVRVIRTLRLRRNLGHQRAIAIGLAHIEQTGSCDAVLVMDADGEDTPEGAVQLVRAFADLRGTKAIFAERTRRFESVTFRFFYQLYRVLHRVLTGISVRVGNFSIVPWAYLSTLVILSETWSHYAAAVFRSRLPFTTIPIPRGQRIAGTSKMNFVAMVTHGLSAMAVFGDVVGARLLIASTSAACLAAFGIVVVAIARLVTNAAIPGWAAYATGALVLIFVQFVMIATTFTFSILSHRTNIGFVPQRDYSLFVAETTDICGRA